MSFEFAFVDGMGQVTFDGNLVWQVSAESLGNPTLPVLRASFASRLYQVLYSE